MNIGYVRCSLYRMLLLGAVLISGMFYAHAASGSQQTDILAVGEGIIKDNNVAGARNEAISDALKNAIEQYLSRYLGNQGMTGNFSVLINDIIPYAGEDIENYYILTEDRRNDICSILVRVKVNEGLMEQRLKDMGIVSIEASSIKILFLVSQKKAPEGELSFWWYNPEGTPALTTTELKLYNIFEEQGMVPINRLSNIPFMTYSEDMTAPELSNAAALEWGNIFSADIIIKGGCAVEYDDMITLDIEAIKVENGELICSVTREEQMDTEEPEEDRFINALQSAIYDIAVQFGPQIIKSFEKTEEETNNILITLGDLNSFEELRVVKKFLEEIDGIKSVVQSRIKDNSMTVSVEFSGTSNDLVKELKGDKGIPVQAEITEIDDNEILIAIEHEMLDFMTNSTD